MISYQLRLDISTPVHCSTRVMWSVGVETMRVNLDRVVATRIRHRKSTSEPEELRPAFMQVDTILVQYWMMNPSSVGDRTPMVNSELGRRLTPIHQPRSTRSVLDEKQSRLLRRSNQSVLSSMMEPSSVGVTTLKDNWVMVVQTLI